MNNVNDIGQHIQEKMYGKNGKKPHFVLRDPRGGCKLAKMHTNINNMVLLHDMDELV